MVRLLKGLGVSYDILANLATFDEAKPHEPAPMKLILASRSPRRRELLEAAGYAFEVCPASESAECGLCSGESPAELVARLAYQKAADVAQQLGEGLILGCDTIAECDGQMLGKPADEHHARQMLQILSGRQHRVLTGLCLWKVPEGRPRVRVAITTLRMDRLTDGQLDDYLAGDQWCGKAGAFGYQDQLGWVHVVEGSETNVVGLPMELLAEMLGAVQQ
jgi:septum formation protein